MPYDASTEFDRQVRTLLELGYPAVAGLSAADFADLLEPLRPACWTGMPRRRPPTASRSCWW